jgi:hypothetical protein
MSDVTRILSQIEAGDPQAAEMLLPLVYDELRKLAASKMAQEKSGQTLVATAHKKWVILSGDRGTHSTRVDSLRLICREFGVTLVCLSAPVCKAGIIFYGPQLTVHLSRILSICSNPTGGQYIIRMLDAEDGRTSFDATWCPAGYVQQGSLCLPEKHVSKNDGSPQSLSRNAQRKAKRLAKIVTES